MDADLEAIRSLIGHVLKAAWRIRFQQVGEIDTSTGALELEFDGDRVVHLTGCGDGESLRIESTRWVDPFSGQLDPVDAEFVRDCGKHVRIKAAGEGIERAIGKRLSRCRLLRNQFGTEAGVEFDLEGRGVRFLVAGDEDHVMSVDDGRFLEWGFACDAWPGLAPA
jgi:hypothetical protein